MKNIIVPFDTWKELNKIKGDFGISTFNEVFTMLLNVDYTSKAPTNKTVAISDKVWKELNFKKIEKGNPTLGATVGNLLEEKGYL